MTLQRTQRPAPSTAIEWRGGDPSFETWLARHNALFQLGAAGREYVPPSRPAKGALVSGRRNASSPGCERLRNRFPYAIAEHATPTTGRRH
jgi:hypothetical protein